MPRREAGVLMTLGQVAEGTGGHVVGDPQIPLGAVLTDSRAALEGALFVALPGDRFDGHDFCLAALEAGAAALLVSAPEAVPESAAGVVVGDTLAALQDLAAWHRRRLDLRVGALTGSAGKTTTKELAASILSLRHDTLATAGNLNNHIGVPLTLLRLQEQHEVAVIEMGCNHHGEIAQLAGIAAPDVGLVTNVGEAHLEGLGCLDGVARAKGELLEALPAGGIAVVNLDDPRVRSMVSEAARVGFGRDPEADVRILGVRLDAGGQLLTLDVSGERVEAPLALLGDHNVQNAAAAVAFARALGATASDIAEGLSHVGPLAGRLAPRVGVSGLRLLDDSYNANPRSMMAALDVLVDVAAGAGAHALLGEMLELGAESASEHEKVGGRAAELGVTTLVGVGDEAESYRAGALAGGFPEGRFVAATTPAEAASEVHRFARPGDVVLIKGSRGARMELALAELLGEEEA